MVDMVVVATVTAAPRDIRIAYDVKVVITLNYGGDVYKRQMLGLPGCR